MNERDVLETLVGIAVETLGIPREDLDESTKLLELGLDSLMLIKFGQRIERQFDVKIEMAWFFKNMPSVGSLARQVLSLGANRVPESRPDRSGPETGRPDAEGLSPRPPLPADQANGRPVTGTPAADEGGLAALFKQQTDALEALFDRQLALLENQAGTGPASAKIRPPSSGTAHDIRGLKLVDEEGLTPGQEAFIQSVVARHVERTGKSRALTQHHRHTLADWKNSLSFRARLKEANYPVVANGSNGARFTDLDGNEYIDIALGMGVNYLGHRHPVVTAAVERRLQAGFELGPQCNMTGPAAEKVARLTGMERVCFCNTGSEAVMIGLRLARARTGRMKVALFNGAYHGIFDGVLGVIEGQEVHPLSPGTPPGMVDDLVILDYDSPASLKTIEAMAGELAAVLVEPVQSRRCGLQPQAFLRRLRKLTREKGIALIFDEMVNGFRVAPGGAQEYFGIRADIALYGKTIGGGLPIGVIAGSAEYMDFIDGGFWQFGDDSLPSGNVIVFGGTFCRHPFAMEAVSAVADYMLTEGPALQDRVNRLAATLTDEVNLWCQDEKVPLRIMRFGSQFKFESYGPWSALANPIELDLFFLLLVDAGIYVWERRTCCLSVVHTEQDVRTIIRAIQQAVTSLRAGGFPFRLETGAPESFHDATSVQKRLFAAMQRNDGQAPYHMPAAWKIQGDLDIERLELGISEIIKRHECLRSGFRLAGGRLVRMVVDEPRFFVERIDPAGRSPERIIADFLRPFDLEQPPLIRIGIAALEDGTRLLIFDSLHIVVDGIALATFTQELNALYNGTELPGAGATYTSYERFMREFEAGEACADHLSYWTGALADAPQPVAFPRRNAAAPRSQNTRHVRRELSPETMDRVRKTAASCGVTPYMFLLGVYATFLRSMAGLSELVVGVATTGRPDKRFEATVGMFVNTLPLRLAPEAGQSFRDFMKHVRSVCADAYQHQDIPYERIAAKTGDTVGTMFTYEVADDRRLALSGLRIEELEAPIPGTMFDFSLDAIEKNRVLHLDFEFDTRAVEEPCVRIWAECFENLIASICANPDVPVGSVPFLPSTGTDADRFQLAGRPVKVPGSPTVLDLFDRAVSARPQATAVRDEDGIMTYTRLDGQSRRIAQLLVSGYGIGPESLVAVLARPSAGVVAVLLGILRAGGAFLPLEPDVPKSRTNRILETAGPRLLIADGDLLDSLVTERSTRIEDVLQQGGKRDPLQAASPDPGSLAYVIYTSGSTGVPKGCEIEHGSLFNYVAWAMEYYFSGRQAGNFCLTSPLAFDMSLMTLLVPLCLGTTLRIPPRNANPAEALALALSPETETDVLNLTPSHVRMIGELGMTKTNVRLAVVGGETLRAEDVSTLLALHPDLAVFNEYGPTETTVGCTAKPVGREDLPAVGRPIFNTVARIVDAEWRTLPPGAWGELCIGGAGVARGYRNLPEMTGRRFVTLGPDARRFYRTGDLARITTDGDIELAGRMDDQIKIAGHRIEPGEIESALLTCRGVQHAAVVFDGLLTAFITGTCEAGTVKQTLAGLLPSYMMPQRVVTVDAMPVLSNGKTDRKKLLAMVRQTVPDGTPDTPRHSVSKGLALLREISGNPALGQSDNFFAAGGNSLDAVTVVARCRQELGIQVGLQEFFTTPTADTIDRSTSPELPLQGLRHTVAQSGILQTAGQQQIWLASMKSGSAYNMTETFFLDGAVDHGKLKASFLELVRRHEILRTTFRELNGKLLQDVQAFSPRCLHVEVATLSGTDAEVEAAVRAQADRESRFSFDLTGGPLMRVILLTRDSHRHYCLLNIHHIITDGWSAALMLEEVSRLYRSNATVSDPPAWQYRDFAAWHAGYLTGPHAEQDLGYWKSNLTPPVHRLSLPGRKTRAPSAAGRDVRPARTVGLEIGEPLFRSLETLARDNGATLFMTLLAGLAAVLHQRTSSPDILVGTPSAGRVLPELETMPGYFLNTLPLRIPCSGDASLRDLMRRAAACASGAFAHQLYPFDRLAGTFDGSRTDGRNPLFDVMLILQNTTDYRFDLSGVRSRRFYSPRSNEAKFELMIELETVGHRLDGIIEYDASLYDAPCIEAFSADYVKTLETAVRTPDAPLANLFTLLSGEDPSSRTRFIRSIADVSEDF